MKTSTFLNIILVSLFILLRSAKMIAQSNTCSDMSDLRAWSITILSNYQSAKQDEKRLAIDAAQKFVEKTERCRINDDFVPWVNKHLPEWISGVSSQGTPTVASRVAPAVAAQAPSTYDAELAKKLGADDRGMKMYVLCILKTGPKDAEIKGKERDDIFAGHFANIGRLAEQGKLAVAGPFEKNDRAYRGLYIFNVPTIEEAEKLVVLDPAVKAGVFVPELTVWYASASLMATPEIHKRIQKPQPKTN
jgi:uncharacterized protein YciI